VSGALRKKGSAMSLLLWTGAALAVLLLALGLRQSGTARWAALVRTHSAELEAGSLDVQERKGAPARYDARELVRLPAPVQRYFQTVLTDGQPIIRAATLEMQGTMNMSATAAQWKPFASVQSVVTRRPGFLWNAHIGLFPGVPALVEDSYITGHGRLLVKLLGWFTVADQQGEGEIARGEFMRYFAETPWYPTALLPSQGVQWQAVDAHSAQATLADGARSLTLLFRFNEAGLIASVRAEARGAAMGKNGAMEMLPWDCSLSDYQRHDGMLIPMTGEAAWVRPEGRRAYFVGHVKALRYTFLH
jgi:hypothetical protein